MGSSGHLRMFEDVWEDIGKASQENRKKRTLCRESGREPNKKYQMNFMQSLKVIRMMEFV